MTSNTQKKITWQVHPLIEEPLIKTILLCLIVCSIILFSFYYLNIFYGLTTLVILFFSLVKYFFKTNFYLSDELVSSSTLIFTTNRKWGSFKRVIKSQTHIHLSPMPKPSRLDQFRSLMLVLPAKKDKTEIENFIRQKLGEVCD